MINKAKYSTLLFLFISLLWSCSTNNSSNIIKLNENQTNRLELNYTSQIVQLETNSESLLQFILKVNIDKANDRIFVLSGFNVYIFNVSGKYISKLKIGRGPEEVRQIVSFTINSKTKTIFAIDSATKLCSFDYNGNMISKYSIEKFPSTDVFCIDDNNVCLLRNFVGGQEKSFVGIYDLSAEKIIKRFISAEKSPYPKNSIGTCNNFSRSEGKLYFYSTNIFGLFEYNDSGFNQILSFDIGNKSVPKRLSDKFSQKKRSMMREEAKSHNFVPFIMYAFHFKGYYFVVVDDENYNCYTINSNNKNIYHNGSLPSYFNLPNKESLKFLSGIQDDLIIFHSNPSDFFDSKTQETSKEISVANHKIEINQYDNPFLIIIQ